MIQLKINKVEYNLKENLNDVTIGDMCKYLKIVTSPERIATERVGGSIDYEYIPFGNESYAFLKQRDEEIIKVLSDIPEEFIEQVAPNLIDLVQIDVTPKEIDVNIPMTLETMRGQFQCPQLNEWTFQMWCDFENLVQEDYMNFYALLFTRPNKPYDRLHPQMRTKYELFAELPAEDNIDYLYYILSSTSMIRRLYQFVYRADEGVGEPAGPATRKHSERFKWLDTIISLANNPAPVFNHPNGTLYGVRNANALDVLDYLNIKRSKEDADYVDWKAKNKNK